MYREFRTHGHDALAPAKALDGVRATVPMTVGQVAMAGRSIPLDNVLAVAGGHVGIPVAGLLISIVMTAFVASLVTRLIHRHRWLAWGVWLSISLSPSK